MVKINMYDEAKATKDELTLIVESYRAGNMGAYDKLIAVSMYKAQSYVNKQFGGGGLNKEELMDMAQDASVQILNALKAYDGETDFSAYLRNTIKFSARRSYQANASRGMCASPDTVRASKRAKRASDALELELGRAPSMEEAAEAAGVRKSTMENYANIGNVFSGDIYPEDGGASVLENRTDGVSAEDLAFEGMGCEVEPSISGILDGLNLDDGVKAAIASAYRKLSSTDAYVAGVFLAQAITSSCPVKETVKICKERKGIPEKQTKQAIKTFNAYANKAAGKLCA